LIKKLAKLKEKLALNQPWLVLSQYKGVKSLHVITKSVERNSILCQSYKIERLSPYY
jgi:hypothetical protein